MATLQEIRSQYPQYNDMSDQQLADSFHDKYYSDIPKDQFYKKIGFSAQPEESFGQKALRYAVKDPLLGMVKAGQSLHNIFYKPDVTDYSAAFGLPEDKKDLADKLIQFAPDLAGSLVLPEAKLGSVGRAIERIPEAGKYLKTALANAISQGGYAAAMSPQDKGTAATEAAGISAPFSALSKAALSGSPALKVASRLGLGAGGGLLGYHGAKALGAGDMTSDLVGALMGLGGIKGLNPKESVLKGVEGTNYQPMLDASRRLGLPYITPAEASGNPFTGAEQGSVGKTEKGAQMLYEKGQNRAEAEKKSISGLLDNIYSPSRDEQKKSELYDQVKNKIVPDEKLLKFRGNPSDSDSGNEIFKSAESKLLNDPAYRQALKGVPKDSIEYLDMVKRTMGDMINSKKGEEQYKKSLISGTQKDLVNTLDNVAPEYKDARAIAERNITRRNIEKAFNNKEMTGSNFGKYLNNDATFSKLKNNVRNVPGAQDQLNDMKMVFNRLINIPTAKSAEALSRSSMSKDRASSATAIRMLQELLSGGRYDKARVNLITNPDWASELGKLKNVSNTDKFIGKAYNLMGKAGAQSIAQ